MAAIALMQTSGKHVRCSSNRLSPFRTRCVSTGCDEGSAEAAPRQPLRTIIAIDKPQ
jgi:hypothetical protein